jgi:DNA polymerase-3 subunit chi
MPEITFYFNVQRRETALCQLVGKALQQQHTINILTDSDAASDSLDRLLWEIPSIGFLPHCAADHPLAAETPICIDHRTALFKPRDILFNWSKQLPPQLNGYQRVIEIVDKTDTLRTEARQRFRAYQAQGYTVKTIDMAHLRAITPEQ